MGQVQFIDDTQKKIGKWAKGTIYNSLLSAQGNPSLNPLQPLASKG